MMEQFFIDTIETLCVIRDIITSVKTDIDGGVNVGNYEDKCYRYIEVFKSANYHIKCYKEEYEKYTKDEIVNQIYKAVNEVSKYFDYYISSLNDTGFTDFFNEFNYIRDSLTTMTLSVNVKLNFMYKTIKNFVK